MFESSNVQILLALAFVGAAAHVALLLSARWLNVVFMACAAFLFVSPLSVATDIPGVELLKWARVYLALLMIAVYLLTYRTIRFGSASWAFLVFLGFYALAGVWSEQPIPAIIFKGMYAMVVVAGLLMASSIRSFADFRVGLRVLTGAALLYALLILVGVAREPGQLLSGRLTVLGWNANRVGHDAAAMLALCLFTGLYDKVKIWKVYSLSLACFFGFITLATGSRGASGMAAVSCMILAAPLFRRPVLLAAVAILGGLVVNFTLRSLANSTIERLGEVDFSNRQAVWSGGLEEFYQNPFTGAGWVFDTGLRASGGTANLHSIYIQILAETGLMGAALFVVCLLVCGVKALGILNALRRYPAATPFAFFAFALGGATLAHGIAESSSLQGTNLNGLFLPFAIGLLDRIPQLIREETGVEDQWEEDLGLSDSGEYAGYTEDVGPGERSSDAEGGYGGTGDGGYGEHPRPA